MNHELRRKMDRMLQELGLNLGLQSNIYLPKEPMLPRQRKLVSHLHSSVRHFTFPVAHSVLLGYLTAEEVLRRAVHFLVVFVFASSLSPSVLSLTILR